MLDGRKPCSADVRKPRLFGARPVFASKALLMGCLGGTVVTG